MEHTEGILKNSNTVDAYVKIPTMILYKTFFSGIKSPFNCML